MIYLALLGNVFWVLLYLYAAIYQYRFRKIVIPYWAMFMNLAWEVLACIISSIDAKTNSNIIPYAVFAGVWAILDIFIFYTHLIIKENKTQKMSTHIIKCLLGVGLCIGVMFSLYVQMCNPFGLNAIRAVSDDANEASFQWQAYTAFGDNVIMSILFIYAIYWNDKKWQTQSLSIGLLKLFGTLNSSITMGFFLLNGGKFDQFHFQAFPFVIGCGIGILILDIVYCYLIYQKRLKHKLNVWIDWPKITKNHSTK